MDYKQFNIKLNMKTLMLFEEMSGKSFYQLDMTDVELLTYCSLVVNNNETLTYPLFKQVMKNTKIAKSLYEKCSKELEYLGQFNHHIENTADPDNTSSEIGRITDIVNALILNYNIDINYVMRDMGLWELSSMVKAMEEKTKADMIEKRFWTYMTICPHIDGKKIKGPEQLLPFPWEKKNKKDDALRFMEDNKDAIRAFFNKNKQEDGKL